MSRGKAMVHLIRLRDMKQHRADTWKGTPEGLNWLKADIAALNVGINAIEALRVLSSPNRAAKPTGRDAEEMASYAATAAGGEDES